MKATAQVVDWVGPPSLEMACRGSAVRLLGCAKYVPRFGYSLASPLVRVLKLRVCKTVGSAYVGSNPTPATDILAGQTSCPPFLTARCGSGPENR